MRDYRWTPDTYRYMAFVIDSMPSDTYEERQDRLICQAYYEGMTPKEILETFRLFQCRRGESIGKLISSERAIQDRLNKHFPERKRKKPLRKTGEEYLRMHRKGFSDSLGDKKCVFCGSEREIEMHHIKPVSEGGLSDPENIIYLCRHCHRTYHSIQRRRHSDGD